MIASVSRMNQVLGILIHARLKRLNATHYLTHASHENTLFRFCLPSEFLFEREAVGVAAHVVASSSVSLLT